MSHHFDTPTGREDPRLNLADFYLFGGNPGRTVMAMTANPEASASTPMPFRDEGIYAFRFDVDGDGHEDVAFRVQFEDAGPQRFQVRRTAGPDAHDDVIAEGQVGELTPDHNGVRAYAGVIHDAFAGNGAALETYEKAFADGRYTPQAFDKVRNLFESRQIGAIVLDVPTELIGDGPVHAWTTISLSGHAPEVQVARWGLPLITHLFIRDPDMREDYNRTAPSEDNTRFTNKIAEVVRETATLAGSTNDPESYSRRLVDRLGTLNLPYQLGSTASFDFAGFNGRAISDDVMDVMLTLMTNTALADGVAPDPALIDAEFPYLRPAPMGAS